MPDTLGGLGLTTPDTTWALFMDMRATTVGIVSIGDMGLGMAKLLKAHHYRVVTVAEGRR